MNMTHLFEMQRKLNEHIIREKGLEEQDLLPNTILALLVELGELGNEWRGFKHWSNDREMRKEKALIEYVDCLHFILSIGLDIGVDMGYMVHLAYPGFQSKNVTKQFNMLFSIVSSLQFRAFNPYPKYEMLLDRFFGLGGMLGFTWEQIEQAYMQKNNENHVRQNNGY